MSALIERLRSAGCDPLQRRGQCRQPHHVTLGGCAAVRQIMTRRARIGAQPVGRHCPVVGNARRDRITLGGVADRGLQNLVEAETALRRQDRSPGLDRSRHRDGVNRIHADRPDALRGEFLGGRRAAGTAGAVIAPDRHIGLRREAKAIAADAGHVRLDHAKCSHRRDRGVRRIAAGPQHVDGRETRERMGGRRHAAPGHDGGAAGQVEVARHGNSPIAIDAGGPQLSFATHAGDRPTHRAARPGW
jgi:hypothetical protein